MHFALFEPACKRFELHTFIWNHSKAVVLALSDKGDIFCCPQPLRVVSRKALAVCKVWLPTRSWGKLSTMLTNFDMCPSNSATLRMQCKQLQTMMLWSPSKYTQTKTHEHTQTRLRKKHTKTDAHTHKHRHKIVHAHMQIHINKHVNTHTHTHTHTHAYKQIHTHTCPHTHKHT